MRGIAVFIALLLLCSGLAASAQGRPETRFDFRVRFQEEDEDIDSVTTIFRFDSTFPYPGGRSLATRFDIPLVLTGTEPSDTSESAVFGLGNLLLQGIHYQPISPEWDVGPGVRLLPPTATSAETGDLNWRVAPMLAATARPKEWREGDFFNIKLFYLTSLGGGPVTRQWAIQPTLNLNLPANWVFIFEPDVRVNYADGDNGAVFFPSGITFGRYINRDTLIALKTDIPLIDNYPRYDWRLELRIVTPLP